MTVAGSDETQDQATRIGLGYYLANSMEYCHGDLPYFSSDYDPSCLLYRC